MSAKKMEQFQKGYSVLENIPEEKLKPLPKTREHSIFPYCYIFLLVGTIIILMSMIMINLPQLWNTTNQEESTGNVVHYWNFDNQFLYSASAVGTFQSMSTRSFNPANILASLNESDGISGDAWKAWTTVEDSAHQHICKIDNGVSNSDFILKRFDIVCTVSSSDELSFVYVDQNYYVPNGFKSTGLIAIDRRKDGSGDSCDLDDLEGGYPSVRLISKTPPALRFTFLVIGREEKVGESRNSTKVMIVKNGSSEVETGSDEEFNEVYVY